MTRPEFTRTPRPAHRIDPDSGEEAAVRALYGELMDGWNSGSGESFAAPFAEDADLIGFDGTLLKGRQRIARFHQRLFENALQGSRLVGRVKRVRFVSADVALMHALGATVMRGKPAPPPGEASIQTVVAVKHDGQWRLAAFQNTRVRPMGRNAAGSLLWSLFDRLWALLLRSKNH